MAGDEIDVEESRDFVRYLVKPPLLAMFDTVDIHIIDFSIRGFRAQHNEVLRIGHRAKTVCVIPPRLENFRFEAEIVWSRFARPDGKFRYISGFRMEKDRARGQTALQRLLMAETVEAPADTLDRKKESILEKQEKLAQAKRFQLIRETLSVSSEHLVMVQRARQYLRDRPDEIETLRARARGRGAVKSADFGPEIEAIWEYLGEKVDLEVIAWILMQD